MKRLMHLSMSCCHTCASHTTSSRDTATHLLGRRSRRLLLAAICLLGLLSLLRLLCLLLAAKSMWPLQGLHLLLGLLALLRRLLRRLLRHDLHWDAGHSMGSGDSTHAGHTQHAKHM